MNESLREGVLLVNKPIHESSYDQIRKLKKAIFPLKIGHSGTLDPFAEGLLIILLGRAVKLQSYFLNLKKVYRVVVQFGAETDTLDHTGEVVARSDSPLTIQEEKLSHFIKEKFLGETEQVPPAYSAVKVKGRKAYSLAREGKMVHLPRRKIKLTDIGIEKWDLEKQQLTLQLTCSSGTYVRVLVKDLANALKHHATTLKLKRLQIGDFSLKDASSFTHRQTKSDWAILENKILSLKNLIPHNPIVVNPIEDSVRHLKNGNFLFLQNAMKLGYNFFYERGVLKAVVCKTLEKTKIIFNDFALDDE